MSKTPFVANSKWPTGPSNTHSEAKCIDPATLKDFLGGLGYVVLNLDQRWRHVHGLVAQDGQELFFKLASTPEIAIKTKNEVRWNEAVAEPLLQLSRGTLVVPKIRQTGHFNDSFFYLADYYSGHFAADHDPPRTADLQQYLSSLSNVALILNQLSDETLWNPEDERKVSSLTNALFADVDFWCANSGRSDLAEIRELVEPLRHDYIARVSHGDFVPWHVIVHGEKRVLIDGEHGWSGRPRYYDVAYFYHRLATSGTRPDLARLFLSEFVRGLPLEEKSEFGRRFLPVLAARSLAGFYDVTLFDDQRKVLGMHLELKDMILRHDLE